MQRTGVIVDAAIKVHSALGPGLLESAYQACLTHALRRRGLHVRTQVLLPLTFEDVVLDEAYRIDLLVDEEIVVEVKAVEALLPVHRFQLLTYLRLSRRKVGLLFNFHEAHLRDGIKRMVNDW